MPTIVGLGKTTNSILIEERICRMASNGPGVFTFDDHELVNDIWGAGSTVAEIIKVFRDIGTRAWLDYLGWANPAAFQFYGQATLAADSDVLVDQEADFTSLPLMKC